MLCVPAVAGHLLTVDLATMFDPHVCDTLGKAKQDCDKCTKKLNELALQ